LLHHEDVTTMPADMYVQAPAPHDQNRHWCHQNHLCCTPDPEGTPVSSGNRPRSACFPCNLLAYLVSTCRNETMREPECPQAALCHCCSQSTKRRVTTLWKQKVENQLRSEPFQARPKLQPSDGHNFNTCRAQAQERKDYPASRDCSARRANSGRHQAG
jgi:hypothetical protein